jgi:uncharacterized protein (DUF1684 family)
MVIPFLLAAMLASSDYRADLAKWRADREERLKAPDGWLTLVGLFWLEEGTNTVGSAEGSRVKLGRGPGRAGHIERRGTAVRWVPSDAHPKPLKTDKQGSPDTVEIAGLKLYVIDRGGKLGVRVKDSESQARSEFTSLDWYPVREDWVVKARFIPQPKKIVFEAQAGGKQEMQSPGYVEWDYDGATYRLTPAIEGDTWFFVFRDATAGKTTYPAARFLYSQPAKDGIAVLDFNKAYNPPCVFTPYATCPLPPPGNRLKIPVEAGEKMYRTGH